MTEKENAQKLYTRYYNQIQSTGEELGMEIIVNFLAKECAIIAADEIIKEIEYGIGPSSEAIEYWKGVINQIEKL